MKAFNVRGNEIYINPVNGDFSLDEEELLTTLPYQVERHPPYSNNLYKSITFCLEVSDVCNLRCAYCFNPSKSGKRMERGTAIGALNNLFSAFPKAERYFIDVSGDGEPLLNLPLIDDLSEYAKRKSDEIDREVTVSLVTNGTLLSKEIANRLQKKGILFGVSLDGNRENHDRYRIDANGRGTYEAVLKNVQSIEHRQYIGCAVTITREPFPLLETIKELKKTFKTISIKPVRSMKLGLNKESLSYWEKEYEILEGELEKELAHGDTSTLFCLLNGDDYFGKFILRSFLNLKALSRCDSGCGRVAVSFDGEYYPCVAMIRGKGKLGGIAKGFDFSSAEAIYSNQCQRKACDGCAFVYSCGGECKVEFEAHGGNNPFMCAFKKKLILLAMLLEEKCRRGEQETYQSVFDFCIQKIQRSGENPALRKYRLKHPELTFTKAKKAFNMEYPEY